MFKRIWRSALMQGTMGSLLAGYLRLVRATNTFVYERPDTYADVDRNQPFILAMWHGQHFMIPFAKQPHHRISVLISRHGDGEMNAIAAAKFGIGLVRGSGAQRSDQVRKRGGVKALLAMLRTLESGSSMSLTADVPKVSRVCGKGIITLAQKSGRPIFPIAVVCSRRIDLDTWDHTSIGLPFGKSSICIGKAISVAPDADDAALEAARLAVEAELDRVHQVAYGLVGAVDPGAGHAAITAARAGAVARPEGRA